MGDKGVARGQKAVSQEKRKSVLHYYVGDLNIANRMLRQAEAASEAYDITVVYRSEREDKGHWANGRFQTIFVPKVKQTPSVASPWQLPRFLYQELRLFLQLVKLNADLFHPHQHSSLLLTCLWLFFTGKPVVFDPHDMHIHDKNKRSILVILKRWLDNLVANRSGAILVVSEGMRDVYKQKYPDKPIYILPNLPASLDKTNTQIEQSKKNYARTVKPAQPIQLVYAGLIKRDRLPLELIEIIGEQDKVVSLDLFGFSPDDYEDTIHHLVHEKGFKNILFHGPYNESDIVSQLLQYDYFILPFRIQSDNIRYCMPNKIYQALAAGLPIIASDMVEVSKLVIDNEIGYIFKDGDYAAFAEILKRLDISGQAFARQRQRVWQVAETLLDYEAYRCQLLSAYETAENR
jgi:glycosyltransferase involved in cell wall biosynthesis